MQNIKITDLNNNNSADSFLSENLRIGVFNPVTKKFKSMSIEDLQRAFGLSGSKFYVGENLGLVPDEKFAVFGDARIFGTLRVDTASVGDPNSGVGGFEIGAEIFVDSIIATSNILTKITLADDCIDFNVNGKDILDLKVDAVIVNAGEASDVNFVVKTSDVDALNNTAFFVDVAKAFVGVGTDSPMGHLDVWGARVIFGSDIGSVLNADLSKRGFAALGGTATGDKAVAFHDGQSTGENGFSLNKGIASGFNSFATNESEAAGISSAAHNKGNVSSGDYSHSEGLNNIVGSEAGHVEGFNNQNYAYAAHLEGTNNLLEDGADFSHGGGDSNTIRSGAIAAFVGGLSGDIKGGGSYSFLGGVGSTVHGEANLCFAFNTDTNGKAAVGIGGENSVSGDYAFVGGFQSLSSGEIAYSNGLRCKSIGDRAVSEGLDSEALASDSYAKGNKAIAEQTGEHAIAAGRTLGAERSQRSKYFLLGEFDYTQMTTGAKLPLTLANLGENIKIQPNSVCNFQVSLVGRGALEDSARVVDQPSLNWGYKFDGYFSVFGSGTGQYLSNTGLPYLYSSRNASIYDPVDPDNFSTDVSIVAAHDEYCELEGITPYIEFNPVAMELELGVVKPHDNSFFDIGALYAGNSDDSASYYLFPSVIFRGKNAFDEELTFDDIAAFFAKNFVYFQTNYNEEITDDYVVKDEFGTVYPNGIDINFFGIGTNGESDLTTLSGSGITGYSGACYGVIGDKINSIWHAVLDLDFVSSNISFTGGSEATITC